MIKINMRFLKTGLFVAAMLFILLFMTKGAIAKTGEAGNGTEAKTNAAETYGKLPLSFIENIGQTDKKISYYERGAGHSIFFTAEGVYLQLVRSQESGVKSNKKEDRHTRERRQKLSAEKKTVESEMVRLI